MSTIHGIIAASILGGLGSGPVDPGEDWNPVYEEALVNNDELTSYCLRNVYAKSQFPATTKQIRVKVQASADAPMLIKGMTAGEREGVHRLDRKRFPVSINLGKDRFGEKVAKDDCNTD